MQVYKGVGNGRASVQRCGAWVCSTVQRCMAVCKGMGSGRASVRRCEAVCEGVGSGCASV